jgi:DNA adenine methylase
VEKAAKPEPFLKWAGSKRKIIGSLRELIPSRYGRYIEPFLGSASLFFHLQPTSAYLADSNSDLIDTYTAIRDKPEAVIRFLKAMRVDRDYFYSIRSNMSRGQYKRAAEFVYLNKTCWNGLYRVNLKGQFNVPYGDPKGSRVFAPENILACAAALSHPDIIVRKADYSQVENIAVAGDFVFFDPPYVTTHNNNGFIEYNENIFSWDDQVKLAALCERLTSKGVKVLVTNANHDSLKELYFRFESQEIIRQSTLASNSKYRRQVTEIAFFA